MADSLQTLDCRMLGSSVHEILQARTLEGLPFPPPGDLPDPGIKPESPALQADSLLNEPQESPRNKHKDTDLILIYLPFICTHTLPPDPLLNSSPVKLTSTFLC